MTKMCSSEVWHIVILLALCAAKEYEVGDVVKVRCEKISPERVYRVEFFSSARTPSLFYLIEKNAEDLIFRTPSKKFHGELTDRGPVLSIKNLQPGDAANYTCIVHTVTNRTLSMTNSILVKCELISRSTKCNEPSFPDDSPKPILRSQGKVVSRRLWYNIGDALSIQCLSMGGYPEPVLEWYQDQEPLDIRWTDEKFWEMMINIGLFPRSSTSEVTLSIQLLTKKHNGTLLTCKAVQVKYHDTV